MEQFRYIVKGTIACNDGYSPDYKYNGEECYVLGFDGGKAVVLMKLYGQDDQLQLVSLNSIIPDKKTMWK